MKDTIIGVVAVAIAILIAFSSCGGCSDSGGGSSSGGFVGSDGKYYSYVPKFGSGVNDWMAKNW